MHQKLNKQPFLDAFLIHKKPYLESKVIVYLLTEAHGLIAAMTHWSQSKKNHLSAFSTLSCQLLIKPNFSQLKKIEIKTFQAPLQGTHLFAGLYINELIYKFFETSVYKTLVFTTNERRQASIWQGGGDHQRSNKTARTPTEASSVWGKLD